MTTYGNLRTAGEDKIKLTGGSDLGGEHPMEDEMHHRTHNLGGEIAKPTGHLKLRHHNLGGEPGHGAITDCYGTKPMKTG